MNYLVLLRHGESQWNLENRFTGFRDVELSPNGEREATEAGQRLKGEQLRALLAIMILAVGARLAIDLFLPPANVYSIAHTGAAQ